MLKQYTQQSYAALTYIIVISHYKLALEGSHSYYKQNSDHTISATEKWDTITERQVIS
jgi:hypothetical protein